jgi:hypothetical protein
MEARIRIAEVLFKDGARADGLGGTSWTPLMNAVSDEPRCGNEKMLELLLKHGASVNHIYVSRYSDSGYRMTPLWAAVEAFFQTGDGWIPGVEVLLQHGADANFRIDGVTPLMALALDLDPDWVGQGGDFSCWDSDNDRVKLFRLLAPKSDLSLTVASTSYSEFNGMTVAQTLKKRLDGGCKYAECVGKGQAGRERCLERMLGSIPH